MVGALKLEIEPFSVCRCQSDLIEPSSLVVTVAQVLQLKFSIWLLEISWGSVFSDFRSWFMGYALPAAIGACMANNVKKTYCFEGDGSLMLNLQELVL